jgi:hypothetical protein
MMPPNCCPGDKSENKSRFGNGKRFLSHRYIGAMGENPGLALELLGRRL